MTGDYKKLDWKPYSRVILDHRLIRNMIVMLTICHMQSATKYMTRQQLHACFQIWMRTETGGCMSWHSALAVYAGLACRVYVSHLSCLIGLLSMASLSWALIEA